MKNSISLSRVAFLALAMGTAAITATFAQTTSSSSTTTTTTTAPTCTGGHCHHGSVLSADERSQLKNDFKAALAANPSLQTQKDSLKQEFKTLKSEGPGVATKDQWQALRQQSQAFHQQMKSAVVLLDPSAQAIFAKLDAAHAAWKQSHQSSNS